MRWIQFAWTLEALLAGEKTVTRRTWTDRFAQKFRAGDLVAAYDRSPRVGGKQVATIRLTAAPHLENTVSMPERDYEREGLLYMERKGLKLKGAHPRRFWNEWIASHQQLWVIRFELISVEDEEHDKSKRR